MSELIRTRGHMYYADVLRTPYSFVRNRIEARERSGTPEAFGPYLAGNRHWQILTAWRDGIHRVAFTTSIGGLEREVCTCSLVSPAGEPLAAAAGHLDQTTWRPTSRFVFSDGAE